MRAESPRARLARLGFRSPSEGAALVDEAGALLDDAALERFARAADPDAALANLVQLQRAEVPGLEDAMRTDATAAPLVRLLGASRGLVEHVRSVPEALAIATHPPVELPDAAALRERMLAAVEAHGDQPVSGQTRSEGIAGMRRRYRAELLGIVGFDLAQPDPVAVVDAVARALADLAAAALEASLAIARASAAERFGAGDVAATKLAIIGMGKLGARELNYVSDVDVIWVHEADGIAEERAALIAQSLARETAAACTELAREPMLWEVDANLRPEGKDGALSRTLPSHVSYYERWAKSWEFQALLKARAVAGDAALGAAYEAAIRPMVWASSSREGFVESVQRMRERVTEHIPADEAPWQLKLGPGGLRDIEFTVQLLQLVHGATDESVRQRATLDAIASLSAASTIGRAEAGEFSDEYRLLRVLEHRAQLWRMTRTHLMPRDDDGQARLARAAGFRDAAAMLERWRDVQRSVRSLHERLFYRPLLSAVAALPDGGTQLTSDQAIARLTASGFRDAKGALEHIAELTSGVTRRAQIQRLLLPVLLEWFAEGADPDMGLLAFRRLSKALGESPWYLRMLRDSAAAAKRLTIALSSSRLVSTLLERQPEAVRWLDDAEALRPRRLEALHDEAASIVRRHRDDPAQTAKAIRGMRRRELLRAALASVLQLADEQSTGGALADIAEAVIQAAIDTHHDGSFEFAVVAMGRTGGRELSFGSDVDVLYVCRGDDTAVQRAGALVRAIGEMLQDPVVAFELDAGLRPEGKQGPLVRSLESYRAYYERWSLAWEAQALLRARPMAGSERLHDDFMALIEPIRYPEVFTEASAREIRRIKARVEGERLPQSADRSRHVKLGRGSLSDVEWLVQLLQLQHAHEVPALRTTSTLEALAVLAQEGILSDRDAEELREAWRLASRVRNASKLAQARTIDVLPSTREQLELLARLMGMRQGSASVLEEAYLQRTRVARRVFDARFFG